MSSQQTSVVASSPHKATFAELAREALWSYVTPLLAAYVWIVNVLQMPNRFAFLNSQLAEIKNENCELKRAISGWESSVAGLQYELNRAGNERARVDEYLRLKLNVLEKRLEALICENQDLRILLSENFAVHQRASSAEVMGTVGHPWGYQVTDLKNRSIVLVDDLVAHRDELLARKMRNSEVQAATFKPVIMTTEIGSHLMRQAEMRTKLWMEAGISVERVRENMAMIESMLRGDIITKTGQYFLITEAKADE